jgi:pantothenate kinase-related protein Tda10
VNDLLDHFDPEQQENENPTYILTLSGDSGSGKTLFARCLIEALRKKLPREQQKVEILTSGLNQESSMRFLAAWRPIVQQLAVIHAKKN